jgi:cysteine synthase
MPFDPVNVFVGPSAVRDFLNPENLPPTPLVEVPDHFNPLRSHGVRIFAKLMYLSPLLNIKSLPAMNMLMEAEADGSLNDVHTIVENSSGNTAFSLAVLAPLFKVERVVSLVPWDIAPGKLDLLRIAGAEPRFRKDVPGNPGAISEAREIGTATGFLNPGQYDNPANPSAYEKWMAPQIWNQTRSCLTVLAGGLGTTGTLVGASNFFKQLRHKVTIVGSVCDPDAAVPGVRSEVRLGEIGFDWRSHIDFLINVRTKESFHRSLQLCRSGIMAGPSSGLALAGLQRFLEERAATSTLDDLRNEQSEVVATFICGDTPLPYLEKYSTHLDPSDF